MSNTYDRTMTPITYFQTPMHEQFRKNREAVQAKPYARYFQTELVVPLAMVRVLNQGALPSGQCFGPTVEALNHWLEHLDDTPLTGFGVADGLTTFTMARHFFPQVNAEMFKWWMRWHAGEPERYSLWFPHSHIITTNLPELSTPEKPVLHVKEYMGGDILEANMHMVSPVQMGFRPELLARQRISIPLSAYMTAIDDHAHLTGGLVHFCREIDGGLEKFSLYWLSPHAEFGRIADIEGAGEASLKKARSQGLTHEKALALAYEMAIHDMTEFTCLGQILPALHAEFGHE